jgi:hypothetical protein
MTASYDSYLDVQLSRHLRNLEQAENDDLWIEQRTEHIKNNLSTEYSSNDVLSGYADSEVPNYTGIHPNPKHWAEYDYVLNSAILYGNCKLLQEFADKAFQLQAKKELEEEKLKHSQ